MNSEETHISIQSEGPHTQTMPVDSPMNDLARASTGTQEMKEISENLLINLLVDTLQRICQPWKFLLIIKLMGKRILHLYLKRKIQELWKPTENFALMDLGADYFIVKFNKEENMSKTLKNGPWFINGFFLSVQKWEPQFVASEAK